MRPLLVAFVLLLPAVAAAAPIPKSKARPLADQLVGEWTVEARHMNGEKMPPEMTVWSIAIPGELNVERNQIRSPWKYKLVEEGKPATLDLTNDSVTYLAIVEVDGNTLRIIYGLRGNNRPAGFDPVEGTTLVVLKRKSP